jgi:ubiquinone/menaquinone biosynthesis C-methylase UbiE
MTDMPPHNDAGVDVSHQELVRAEFSRQAEAMASAPAFSAAAIIDRFKDAIASKASGVMLDLACGPAILLASLASTMRLSVGADVTPKMIQMARATCAASPATTQFIESLAECLPFATAAIDCVVTRLSIHHFLDPLVVLREVKRVLKPDGLLVIGDLTSSEDPTESRLHNALEQLRDPSHIRMLPESELLQIVNAAGFRVIATGHWLQQRQFKEWAAIVENARSLQSLEVAMRTIAERGVTAGIDLRVSADSVEFAHRWVFIAAQPVT